MNTLAEKVGATIAFLRHATGLSREELAEKLKQKYGWLICDWHLVRRIEEGLTELPENRLKDVYGALDFSRKTFIWCSLEIAKLKKALAVTARRA